MTCEFRAGVLTYHDHLDPSGRGSTLGGGGDVDMTASGTCVVPGPDPSHPAVYDARMTDLSELSNEVCGSFFVTSSFYPWWGEGGVSLQLYDSTGVLSPESAAGVWEIDWSGGGISYSDFWDDEGDHGRAFGGYFQVRGLDRVDCMTNGYAPVVGSVPSWRRLTFDAAFTIVYDLP